MADLLGVVEYEGISAVRVFKNDEGVESLTKYLLCLANWKLKLSHVKIRVFFALGVISQGKKTR